MQTRQIRGYCTLCRHQASVPTARVFRGTVGRPALYRPADRTHFTQLSKVFVDPSGGPIFRGKVTLLLGRDSASAAETFAMALMGRSPHVVRIGENTQGVFADVLDRRLPNAWRLVLPNQILVTSEGVSFDVAGVPPETRMSVFSPEDLRAGRDAGIEAALKGTESAARTSIIGCFSGAY